LSNALHFQIEEVASIFASEEVITKGLLADYMFQATPYRKKALEDSKNQSLNWQESANESYIREAGWYFKTLAVQEVGKMIKLLCRIEALEEATSALHKISLIFMV